MEKTGLIYTTDSCVGCNKCIKGCPAIGANISIDAKEGSRITVDGSKCIHCGNCLKNCAHDARRFNDDLNELIEALNAGTPTILMIAPSFFLSYPDEAPKILSILRDMGFMAIYDVSFGANITTWALIKYMKESGRSGLISSACPVVVDYIQKYKPSLIDRLMPIMSPVGCLTTYLKNYTYGKEDNSNIKYAFLCPCLGKHDEYSSYPNGTRIDYTFTYKSLFSYMESNIKMDDYEGRSDHCDKLHIPGKGMLYPVPGGLRSNIASIIGNTNFIKQIEGPSRIYKYLDVYENMVTNNDSLPYMVDILNCEGGCGEGVATNYTAEEAEVKMTVMQKNIRGAMSNNSDNINGSTLTPDERWIALDNQMAQELHLNLDTFMRTYDTTAAVKESGVSEEAIEEIFVQMNKRSEYDRTINCTSCGYAGCREMAKAIYYGYNTPESCVHYVKNTLIESKAELEKVLVALSGGPAGTGLATVKTEEIVQQIADAMIEVERQREEVNNSVAVKTQMFANLTHELRTPLNAIINMAELMDTANLSSEQLDNINGIKTAGNSLMDTINEILDISKITSGKFTITEDEYYLHDLLGEIVTVMNFRCLEKKLTFIRELDPSTPDLLVGDFKRIRQVMINIIGNAVKYTEKGSVTIYAGWNNNLDNPEMQFSVTDTGIGIKEDDIPFLFDSYKQVNESETKHIEGTGLGLAISKNIVSEMHGEITVKSKYGVGTTFTLTLPQAVPRYLPIGKVMKKNNQQSAEPVPTSKDFFVPSYRVLVVDDLQVNLHIARSLLDKFQIYADIAQSGEEAIRRCAVTKYDLIFMDQQMPEMSGLETVREIQCKCEINVKTPIVYMSANDEATFVDKIAAGELFQGYIEKPVKIDNLKKTLLELIDPSKIVYDEGGFIPEKADLQNAVNSRDYEKYLDLMAALERYSKIHDPGHTHRLASKFRIMLQTGMLQTPIKNLPSIEAMCAVLRNRKS